MANKELSGTSRKETLEAAKPTLPLRLVNIAGNVLSNLGLSIGLSQQNLRDAAKEKTTLSDFGDSSFEEPLSVLINSIETESRLTYFGRIMARQIISTALINRLRIQSETSNHPKFFDIPIKRPIFIIGYPRTGTTLLHNLLALDTKSRTLKMYEALNPIEPGELNDIKQDPRIIEANKFIKMAHYISPHVSVIHSMSATGPDECLKLIENTFTSPHFLLYFHIPSYWDWLRRQGVDVSAKVYEYHRRQLQLIGRGNSDIRWVLKAPVHLFFLDALLRIYPDARIIYLHRDPAVAIPSFCSLIAVSRAMASKSVDLKNIGKFALKLYQTSSENALSVRKLLKDPRQIYDLDYQTLVRDPWLSTTDLCFFRHYAGTRPGTINKCVARQKPTI